MELGLNVALSGQIAFERRLTTIADNIANMSTVGFRQTGVRFSEMIETGKASKSSFVSPGVGIISDRQGPLISTGNQFDFSISGGGWFMVETPAGAALTRDGRFQITADGSLANLEGFPVLDQAGSPIQLNAAAGPVTSDGSGILHQRGTVVGSIGVFETGPVDETLRVGTLSFLDAGQAPTAADDGSYTIQQGFVENSNVDPLQQISALILLQRNFEQSSHLLEKSESSLQEAIRLLGSK